ncbi:hypothetical protein PVAND_008445 [Polypedilum vanderplanki]|uniref:Uncharacterized protein n=1 Tax=Polypedilum vanderplanki TaxID=319348 RepID=A0A9J6CAN2_POLVA|nr:hypothetical protein PVAND_008445 [Polypedilum vanderplanki]
MLNICYFLHMKSPLAAKGIYNPLMHNYGNPLHMNEQRQPNENNNTNNNTTHSTDMSFSLNTSGPSFFQPNPSSQVPRAGASTSQTQQSSRVNSTPVNNNQNARAEANQAPPNMRGSVEPEVMERSQFMPRRFDDTELKIVNTIKSWPNKYDGTQANLVQCVESWMQRTTDIITPAKVLNNIEWLLEGDALAWHKLFGTSIQTWDEYVARMQSYMNRGKSQPEIEADFNDSRHNQKPHEDYVSYYTRLKAMSNKLTIPLTEEKLYERVKRGLRAEYFTCRITARDLTDLMAKCADFENSRVYNEEYERVTSSESYEWIKDHQKRERENFSRNNRGRSPFKPFPRRESGDNRPGFSGRRNPRWEHRESNENRKIEGRRYYNINESSGEEEEEIPELSRGDVRAMHESDEEFVNLRGVEVRDYAQKLNMTKRDFEKYQANQRCSNCRYRGHTIDQCPDAKRGLWYEHCRKCYRPKVSTDNCPNCQLPKN